MYDKQIKYAVNKRIFFFQQKPKWQAKTNQPTIWLKRLRNCLRANIKKRRNSLQLWCKANAAQKGLKSLLVKTTLGKTQAHKASFYHL